MDKQNGYCVMVYENWEQIFKDEFSNYLSFYFETLDETMRFAAEMIDMQNKAVVIHELENEEE